MATDLIPKISTLVVKIPETVYIQPLKDKASVQKNILHAISRTLNNIDLEIIYSGQKNEPDLNQIISETFNSIIVTINVLEKGESTFDFSEQKAIILRRFKNELQKSDEHIIIDRIENKNNASQRIIDVYIKSVGIVRKTRMPVRHPQISAA